MTRYHVLQHGHIISRHRYVTHAIAAATSAARAEGLAAPATEACCSDDGWPSVYDTETESWIDYPAPQETER